MRFNWKRSSVVPFRLLAYHFFSFISSVLFSAIENERTQYILEGQSECSQLHRVSARCNDMIPFPSCSSTVLWSYLILPDPLWLKNPASSLAEEGSECFSLLHIVTVILQYCKAGPPGTIVATSPRAFCPYFCMPGRTR